MLGLVVGLLTPAAPVAGVAGFGDVEPERYYTEPVQWMVDEHIIDTGSSTCFAPDVAANRGETALYMWRMLEQPSAPPHPYEDVIGEDQNKAVAWIYANKITTGKIPTAFAPNDTLTRGEVAASLHRLAGKPHVTSHPFTATSHPFTDVTTPWQQQPVAWLFRSGITTGTSPTTFPGSNRRGFLFLRAARRQDGDLLGTRLQQPIRLTARAVRRHSPPCVLRVTS